MMRLDRAHALLRVGAQRVGLRAQMTRECRGGGDAGVLRKAAWKIGEQGARHPRHCAPDGGDLRYLQCGCGGLGAKGGVRP